MDPRAGRAYARRWFDGDVEMLRHSLLCAGAILLTACATSPRGAISDRFVDLGLSKERADCLAGDLADRLDRDDLQATSDFLTDLNDAGSAGGALDALLGIDNPQIAGAIAAASVACAFNRG